jgi:hypothetical protein
MNLTKADRLVERGASALESWARDLALDGGLRRQVAEELVHDAAFLRKLKPSLIIARAKGEAPTDQKPAQGTVAPSGPQLGTRPRPGRGGPNPVLVVGLAFAAGILLAKVIDWRGHAHPRD